MNALKKQLKECEVNESRTIRMAEALKESEERFRATFEHAAVGIAHVAPDGRFIRTNRKFCEITGYSCADLMGKTFSDITYSEDVDLDLKHFDQLSRRKIDTYSIVKRYVRKDRPLVWVNLTVSAIRQPDGTPKYFIGVIEDITPHKQIEERLQLTQFSVDKFTDSAIWLGPAGRVLYVNEATCRSLGYGREELLSMNIMDIDPNFSQEKYLQLWEEVKQIGSIKFESYHIRKDGSMFPVEVSANYLKFKDSEYLITIDRDISGRKQSTHALWESREMLRLVMNNIPQAIFWKDINSVYLGCNATFARYSGVGNPENIVGKTDYDLAWKKEEAESFRRYDRAVMDNDMPIYHIIEPQLQADGKQAWLDTNKIPMHDNAGNVVGILGTYEDITDRVEAEKKLRAKEADLARSQRITRLGSYSWDVESDRIIWSDEYYRIMGCTPQEFPVTYELFLQFVHPDYRDYVNRAVAESIHEKKRLDIDYRIIRQDGTERIVHSEGEWLLENGRHSRLFGTILDITERKNTEMALEEAKSQTDLYVDLMSHDIGNMNQAMMGYLEMALDLSSLNEEERSLIVRTLEIIKNSSRLIENVRKLKKLQSMDAPLEKIDIGKILSQVKASYHPVSGRDIEINYAPKYGCFVEANDMVRDVFSSLVENSIKHSSGNLTIDILLDRVYRGNRHYYRVVVDDNGPGISDELKKVLFADVRTWEHKALRRGLGLLLARTLVEMYGGKIWVEDHVSGDYARGSRFVVLLPAVE